MLGQPIDGLSVVSVTAALHAVLFVGDLSQGELTQLAEAISVPLSRRLSGSVAAPDRTHTYRNALERQREYAQLAAGKIADALE